MKTMTVKEAVKRSGVPVLLAGASINAAETLIRPGEKVRHAVTANCNVNDKRANGVLVVTSHRIIFCNSTLGKVYANHILLEGCVGLGDIINGQVVSKMEISGDDATIIVELDKKPLMTLQATILDAIEDYHNQTLINFSGMVSTAPAQSKAIAEETIATNKASDTIKICHVCGDRLLAGARKCPSCGSKDLVEVDRQDTERIAQLRAAAHTSQVRAVSSMAAMPTMPMTKRSQAKQRIKENKADGVACCPKCGSTSLSANKKGFSAGKAAAGIFLTGGLAGAVAGGIGANKIEITCLNCGHKFRP